MTNNCKKYIKQTYNALAGDTTGTDLFRSPGDQDTKGLAEEAGQKRVEWWSTLQKCVHLVQQGRVRGELFIDLRNITGDHFTGNVGELEPQLLLQVW